MKVRFGMAAAAALALVLAGCSSSSKKVTTNATPTTAAGAATASGGGSVGAYGVPATDIPSSQAAPAGGPLVSLADDPKQGPHLVGANGHTLYLFEKDNGTTTACTGGCVAVWPGLAATGPLTGGAGVDTAKMSTANGEVANQVVYNGHLLYFFSGDSAPGQINGTKIPAWYPVSPAGDKIDKD